MSLAVDRHGSGSSLQSDASVLCGTGKRERCVTGQTWVRARRTSIGSRGSTGTGLIPAQHTLYLDSSASPKGNSYGPHLTSFSRIELRPMTQRYRWAASLTNPFADPLPHCPTGTIFYSPLRRPSRPNQSYIRTNQQHEGRRLDNCQRYPPRQYPATPPSPHESEVLLDVILEVQISTALSSVHTLESHYQAYQYPLSNRTAASTLRPRTRTQRCTYNSVLHLLAQPNDFR